MLARRRLGRLSSKASGCGARRVIRRAIVGRSSVSCEVADGLVTLGRRMSDLPAHPRSAPHQSLRSYEEFLEDIKARIRTAQARAARAINAELVEVYWQIGDEILRRQAQEGPRPPSTAPSC